MKKTPIARLFLLFLMASLLSCSSSNRSPDTKAAPPPPLAKAAPPEATPLPGVTGATGSGGRVYSKKRAAAPAPSASAATIKVFYATDRHQAAGTLVSFEGKRGDGSLQFGSFSVSIPRDHRLARIERPSIWRFEFRENPDKHFIIVSRTPEDENDFYRDVSQTIEASEDKQAFVFIHGFNVTFDDAIYRTAQLAYDLGFSGAPILYSWPSNGKVQSYTWDMTANDWSVPHLRAFLESVASRTGARTVHLIAHSMGNRLLVNALSGMRNSASPRFQQIVLTAPDIDAATFVQLADEVKSHAGHVTLYASSRDRALLASKKVNGAPRAGDAGTSIVIVDGIDTIDASALDTDFLGHSYYGDNRSVLTDIFTLVRSGDPPGKRFGLHPQGAPPKLYWLFQP